MEGNVRRKMDVAFVLSSCDKCSDLWEPFFTLLRRHWPDFDFPVYLCTDRKVFQFEDFDIRCPLRMPANSTWSENLMVLLGQMREEYVLFMLDDFWLKADVDVAQVEQCRQMMASDNQLGFICMVSQLEPSAENPLSSRYPDFIKYGRRTPYRVTTQAGLWRRDYLQSLLRSHESAWWFEIFGSKRSRWSKYESYVVCESIFSYDDGGVLYRGSYVSEHVRYFMEHEGIVLNPARRVACKEELMAGQKELTLLQKLSPHFAYNYFRSHF